MTRVRFGSLERSGSTVSSRGPLEEDTTSKKRLKHVVTDINDVVLHKVICG